MASTKTLLKSIERKGRRLERMKSSLPFIKNMYKWQDKKEKIEVLEKEILLIEQQVVFNNAIRNQEAKGDERKHHDSEVVP